MTDIKEEIEKNLKIRESQRETSPEQDWSLFNLIHNYSGPNFDDYMNRFLRIKYQNT